MPLGRRVPSPLEPCALALLQEGSWYGLVPTGYKFECGECRTAKGLHLGLSSKNKRRHRNVNERTRKRKRGSAENVHLQRRNGRTDRSSARASAVNPSRLPARPSGLRGLTAQRGQANESAVGHQCRTALTRREPLETMFFLENFLTREASYKPSYLISWSHSGPACLPSVGRQNSNLGMSRR